MRVSIHAPTKVTSARFRVALSRSELKKCTGYEEPLSSLRATLRRSKDRNDEFEISFSSKGLSKVTRINLLNKSPTATSGEFTVQAREYGLVGHKVGYININPNIDAQKIRFRVPKNFVDENLQAIPPSKRKSEAAVIKSSELSLKEEFKLALEILNEAAEKMPGQITFEQDKETGKLSAHWVHEEKF